MAIITEKTPLGEILDYPGSKEILEAHELPCLHCGFAAFEMEVLKLGEVAKAYHIDLKSLLEDLNKKLGKAARKKIRKIGRKK